MTLDPNQFAQSTTKGMLDLKFSPNTISAAVKSDESTALVPGQAVTIVDEATDLPTVTAATDAADAIFGFVSYNQKTSSFAAGESLEISFFRGNVMYMEAGAAIAKGAQVMIVVTGQKVITAATGSDRIVGIVLDKAAADGDLVRVLIDLPGDLTAA